METLWFCLVASTLAAYVALDGFDLGAGIVHFAVARDERERRTVLRSIGPVWDGNEVWLLAAGGVLYVAFPQVYASSFSGFYLPLMIVLWLLMLRGLGIEFRHRLQSPMWRVFWDVVFSVGSVLLAIFFGAALGNVVRGVPLKADGYFFEPLWTTFTVVPEAGVLDWFTVIMGLVAFCTLTVHGANFVAMKTEGEIQGRARSIAGRMWWGVVLTSVAALIATSSIHPELWANYGRYPLGYVLPLLGLAAVAGMHYYNRAKRDGWAFASSAVFIGGMLAATAFGLFPNLLAASTDPAYNLTVHNAIAHEYGLGVGIVWWIIGITLALGYFGFVFFVHKGKVKVPVEGEGY